MNANKSKPCSELPEKLDKFSQLRRKLEIHKMRQDWEKSLIEMDAKGQLLPTNILGFHNYQHRNHRRNPAR
jgi:hypothetical protein